MASCTSWFTLPKTSRIQYTTRIKTQNRRSELRPSLWPAHLGIELARSGSTGTAPVAARGRLWQWRQERRGRAGRTRQTSRIGTHGPSSVPGSCSWWPSHCHLSSDNGARSKNPQNAYLWPEYPEACLGSPTFYGPKYTGCFLSCRKLSHIYKAGARQHLSHRWGWDTTFHSFQQHLEPWPCRGIKRRAEMAAVQNSAWSTGAEVEALPHHPQRGHWCSHSAAGLTGMTGR